MREDGASCAEQQDWQFGMPSQGIPLSTKDAVLAGVKSGSRESRCIGMVLCNMLQVTEVPFVCNSL